MTDLPSVVQRLLRYVQIDTQSDESSKSRPSTAKQLDLSRLLVNELKELGVDDAFLDDAGFVTGTIPSNVDRPVPTIGLLAHVDTSPEMNGNGVKPKVHRNYDGGALVLNDTYTLTPERSPELANHIGDTIITTSGDTLLGADNKAGISEIMTLVERLRANPDIPHGPIRIAFTRDEEIGGGIDGFDLERFGADAAYTVDGGTLGQIENETFCADGAIATFTGTNVHTSIAKGKMTNALRMAAAFVEALPAELSPEGTEGREGFIHPLTCTGGVEHATVKLILRDFELEGLAGQRELLNAAISQVAERYPGGQASIEFSETYRNMRFVLDDHPEVVELALEATRRAGIEPELLPIRGGTDGALLAFKGLPTPNIFTGGHLFHSRYEWASMNTMLKTVDTLEQLVQLWADRVKE